MDGINKLDADKFKARFFDKSLEFKIYGYNTKNYQFSVPRLSGKIVPKKCKYLIQPNKIVISLFKANQYKFHTLNFPMLGADEDEDWK